MTVAAPRATKRGIKASHERPDEKGAVSVYGMGRFPVTLYKEQWIKILDMSDVIRTFITDNNAALKEKE